MDATHTLAYIFVQIGVGTPDNGPLFGCNYNGTSFNSIDTSINTYLFG